MQSLARCYVAVCVVGAIHAVRRGRHARFLHVQLPGTPIQHALTIGSPLSASPIMQVALLAADALRTLRDDLGPRVTTVAADVSDDSLAERLVAENRPQLLVLNAGTTPHATPIHEQTWETFSRNWETDVRHVFEFTGAALRAPLPPGSTVISLSSGAARAGSPLSGGYARAKATVGFVNDYARGEAERRGLGIRFVSLLPKLTPATGLGATFVDAYASYAGLDRDTYLDQLGPALDPGQVAEAVAALADPNRTADPASSYLITADGLQALS